MVDLASVASHLLFDHEGVDLKDKLPCFAFLADGTE